MAPRPLADPGPGDAADPARKLALRMLEDFRGTGGQRLPGTRALAARYGVGRKSVLAAAAWLRREGKLAYTQRRGLRLAGAEDDLDASGAFAHRLRQAIREGRYRPGLELPKANFFAKTEGLSNHSVLAGLHRLEREGWVHARGRAWLAGPSPGDGPGGDFVLAILLTRPQDWTSLYGDRTWEFPTEFTAEAQRRRVRLLPLMVRGPRSGGVEAPLTLAQALQAARRLGPAYGGLLIPLDGIDQLPDLPAWIRAFLGLGRPVVWFDRYGQGLPRPLRAPGFYRCHFSEPETLDACLDYAAQRGIARVLYPCVRGVDWHERRGEALLALARSRYPSLDFRVVSHDPGDFGAGMRAFPATLGFFRARGAQIAREELRRFARAFPEFEAAITREDPGQPFFHLYQKLTGGRRAALPAYPLIKSLLMHPTFEDLLRHRAKASLMLFPNDGFAALFRVWALARGYRVPEDFSLMGFDHAWEKTLQPITSVDFGFRYLGYAAFHALLGDIPVARDRGGDVAPRPRVHEHGSVMRAGE